MNFSITPERPTSVCWFVIFLLITYSHKMAVAAPDITTKYIRSGSTVREGHNSWCCSSSSSISPLQWTPVNFQLPLPENFSQKPQKAALPMSIKSELLKKKIHIPKEQPQPILRESWHINTLVHWSFWGITSTQMIYAFFQWFLCIIKLQSPTVVPAL